MSRYRLGYKVAAWNPLVSQNLSESPIPTNPKSKFLFHLIPLDSLGIKASACRDGQWEATLQLIDRFYKEGHQAEAWKFLLIL